MKRILALSLMLVLIFSMGAMAQILDHGIGSLAGEDELEVTTDVTVTIDEYARVWITSNRLFQSADDKDNLLGRPGLYTSNKWQVRQYAETYFKTKIDAEYWPEVNEGWIGDEGYDQDGGAYFNVETNCDANVNVAFAWNEGQEMDSELVLWVFRHDEPNWPLVNTNTDRAGRGALVSTKGPDNFNFSHNYVEQHEEGREYKIGGGLFIDFISQQRADTYEGVITITVSAAADGGAV